jgi:hypothetical protein
LRRLNAITEYERIAFDLGNELDRHVTEASAALRHHKGFVRSASDSYTNFCQQYDYLLQNGPSSVSAFSKFVAAAARSWFEVSSDFQRDKTVPAWNQSPQPGPTCYLSGVTNYVHILVFHSCGRAGDDTKMSQNLVYVREDRVIGANKSDDTLSTLADALLGQRRTTFSQPPIYRSGYNENGKVL